MRGKRVLALGMALVWMLAMFSSCDKTPPPPEDTPIVLENGNVLTLPEEHGTEEELTAVRDELMKHTELEGFGDVDKLELYENGVRTTGAEYVQVKDNKKFYYSGDTKRLVNYADGYILDMPAEWKPDFTLSSAISRFYTEELMLVASNESDHMRMLTPSKDAEDPAYAMGEAYVESMFRFITTEEYYEKNQVEKLAETTLDREDGTRAYVLRLHLQGCAEGVKAYSPSYRDAGNSTDATSMDAGRRVSPETEEILIAPWLICFSLPSSGIDHTPVSWIILSRRPFTSMSAASQNTVFPLPSSPLASMVIL